MSRSNRQIECREPITDRKQLIGFGKYKAETIQDILDNDPQYLVWLHENTDFELGHELLEEAENNGKPDHEFKGFTARYDPR
jgi:hypothetical protein